MSSTNHPGWTRSGLAAGPDAIDTTTRGLRSITGDGSIDTALRGMSMKPAPSRSRPLKGATAWHATGPRWVGQQVLDGYS